MRQPSRLPARLARLAVLAVALAARGASGSDDTVGDDADSETEQEWSTREDARFTVTLAKPWLLRGDELTPSDASLTITVKAVAGTTRVRGAIDGGPVKVATRNPDGTFSLTLPVDKLAIGEHTVQLAAGYARTAFAARTFQLSAPAYVVVSTDFDDTRFGNDKIANMATLRTHHAGLVYSHFFAPFHYTDPEVSAARKIEIERWVKEMRDTHGDELGVHIHTWCHFVTAAGVTCRPTNNFAPDDTSGYVTILASYSQADMTKMLQHSVKLFADHGLGRPSSFRAGGWTADLSTLRALEATGFTVDSSALPTRRIEEWRGYTLYSWNLSNWNGIDEKSQPYFASTENLVKDTPTPNVGVLEVPDNGILVDYVTGQEMVDIYEMNAPTGKALAKPTLFQIGFHPPNFSTSYLSRMEIALSHVDARLASKGLGPAVYARISDLQRVWKKGGN